MQDKPALFSTALMWLLAELFEQLPEVGDLDKPKLVFFFDEAHLLFADATKAFLESVARTVRLIRSKGVGVFFVTQSPTDIRARCSASSATRVQHALRAFTPEDAEALQATVATYPTSELYDLEKLLTQLGTGEAAVTILSERGVPTPVVHTRLRAPASRMTRARRRRRGGEGVAALREVRHADRPRERRARCSRPAWRRRRAARRARPVPEPMRDRAARRPPRAAPATRSRTSSARARAGRSSARSCAACSGCCASASDPRAVSFTDG